MAFATVEKISHRPKPRAKFVTIPGAGPKPEPKPKPAARKKAAPKPVSPRVAAKRDDKARRLHRKVANPRKAWSRANQAKAEKLKRNRHARPSSVGLAYCACDCGERTMNTFTRGHVRRVQGQILKVARGEGRPTEVGMSPWLANHLGPWRQKGKGMIPSKHYMSLPQRPAKKGRG